MNDNKFIVLNDKMYEINKINEIKNFFCLYLKTKKKSVFLLEDQKNIYTFCFILACIKMRKTFVLLNNENSDKKNKNICNQLKIDCIEDQNSLKMIVDKSDFNQVESLQEIDPDENDYLMYIMYTSGSTGEPKGVKVNFSAVLNTLKGVNEINPLTKKDCLLNISRWSFDLSIYDIVQFLYNDVSLICIENAKNMQQVHKMFDNYSITVWNSTPQIFKMYLTYLKLMKKKSINSLGTVLLSGDKLEKGLAEEHYYFFPKTRLISLGGATECAIWSVYFDCVDSFESNIAPYGKALPSQQVSVELFDDQGVGEIIIEGKSVGLGYVDNEQKTKESFAIVNNNKIYKTGDIGYFDENGVLFILGRMDNQFKLRGIRINLDDIDNLFFLRGIQSAIAIINPEKDKIDIFFNKNMLTQEDVRQIISINLDKSIVIGKIIGVTNFLLTENGKIDKKIRGGKN